VSRPPFVDAVHAAEDLGVTLETVLDWVQAGRLQAIGGRSSNPFLRSGDVAALGSELGLPREEEAPRRQKSGSSRVQTRLTADARWSDIAEDDIRDWAIRADEARRAAGRKAAEIARQRLDVLLRMLDEAGAEA
jgi:hypothetical protein